MPNMRLIPSLCCSLLVSATTSAEQQTVTTTYSINATPQVISATTQRPLVAPAPQQNGVPKPPFVADGDGAPRIQIAMLLDTSNSMDGLINQARSQLWAIVNSVGSATHNGHRTMVEVALYEYGKSTLAASDNHLRQVLPFTTDLDRVSEQLFTLNTKGGEEYCGAVIRAASRELSWSTRATDLKCIIIAGNEPFNQGMIDYRPAVIEAAHAQGIVINTIFCGNKEQGQLTGWFDGAHLAGGTYGSINQDKAIVDIPTPQDEELNRLGVAINQTYVPYGNNGQAGVARQMVQDSNSTGISVGNFASRALCKSSANYCNDQWDLVDAVTQKKVDLQTIAVTDLPAIMRTLSHEQRLAYIAGKQQERKNMQERMQVLGRDRAAFLAAQVKGNAPALDDVIIIGIREQATRRGFTFH